VGILVSMASAASAQPGRFSLGVRGVITAAFADWQIEDRVSGATGSIGDYLAYGGQLGFGLRL
jgi:hypothetical protein